MFSKHFCWFYRVKMTAAVAPAGANLLHNMQTSTSSSVVDIDLAQASSKPQSVRFYCSDVPDFTEFFYSKKLSDVNIVIGDRKISAHRSRLASVSPFLASVFSSDNSEVSTVILPDVSYQAANVLVNFLYSGYMRVAKKEVTLVLEVASLLGINYPIDVEETEIGVVRIKPLDPKKRNAGSELGGGFAKRARKEMPRVAIYDGDKVNIFNLKNYIFHFLERSVQYLKKNLFGIGTRLFYNFIKMCITLRK